MSPATEDPRDVVELAIPAVAAWVVLVRTAATATGARADLSVDRLDDLALAVDEAAALLLAVARIDERLHVALRTWADGTVEVELSTPSDASPPAANSFAWLVLTALVDDVSARGDGSHLTVSLRLDPATAPVGP